jgi:hypothetical protein
MFDPAPKGLVFDNGLDRGTMCGQNKKGALLGCKSEDNDSDRLRGQRNIRRWRGAPTTRGQPGHRKLAPWRRAAQAASS